MKRIKQFLMGTVLAAAGFAAMPFTSYAQTSDRPSAMRWKGADVDTLKGEFLLYNVGTGKFMTAGGGWGVQGMLLYQDFGTMMSLGSKGKNTYVIKSNIENDDYANAKYLGINYPDYTSVEKWGGSNTFGPIMEAQINGTLEYNKLEKYSYDRAWTFERVKGISDSYVYNMKETLTRTFKWDLELYMGASYGENPEKGPEGGYDVFVGDAATFTTTKAFESTFASGKEKATYYQWILVPKSEIMDVYNKSIEAGGGLNANFTYLVTDPMFDRNHGKFSAWTGNIKGSGTGTDKRYDWLNNKTMPEKNWDAADFQKVSIESKENGKYSFASFDGIGEVSQTFKAPAEGVYEIECRGFYQGNKAKLFVTVGGVTKEASLVNTGSEFTKCTVVSNYGGTTVTEAQKLAAGKALYDNENGKYTVKVVIYATAKSDIKIGIKKDAATKSDTCYRVKTGGTSDNPEYTYYCYDTDFVGVDNFAVRYVGKSKASIFVLDEDSTSEDYMKKATGDAYKDVTVYLKRSFTLNKWNSFVTPVGLTNAQVKQAFGDDVKVAELAGVGGVTGRESSIEFRTVNLSQEGIAIKPAQMYLVKPTKDAVDMNLELVDGTKVSGKMYLIGRCSLDGSKITNGTLKIKPTYGQPTEGVEQVDFMGTYVALDTIKGPQKGAYAWSGGDMYHLKKANAIKGFRGWLVDHTETGTHSIKFNIGDGSVTSIDEVIANDRAEKTSDAVYTVDGVKIRDNASSLEGLPAGLYIFKGKTHLVK